MTGRRPLLLAGLVALMALLACAPPPAVDQSLLPAQDREVPLTAAAPDARPPAGGYLALRPPGAFDLLPDDERAAAMVRRSTWEPRQQNTAANQAVAPADFRPAGYPGMLNESAIFGRITGNFTGTTDEIIQWGAAKWGLPDDLVRAQAVVESGWFQNHKEPDGKPIDQQGYGDFGDCGGSPDASGYGPDGPSSFGLLQAKWCTLNDPDQSGFGGWPWTENSTAYAVDTYGAIMRACLEGWDVWLGPEYKPGDVWGCAGRWFAGGWYNPPANDYIHRVQQALRDKPWLRW
ncbi:hypothetical protein ACQPX6_20495 [Actinomycetospora sp. CA-101289]|uniref:hypothetical protein n=1 Tax=Actinomycetospora sp. CA-101289 TaxID=3239893 RepID=UPI003D96F82C